MGDVSEESLLDYIFKAGGRVKNADLLKTYKHFITHNDQQLRAKYREEFKLIIDRIAVVKSENGEKYLVLKKKYKQQMQEREAGRAASSERHGQRQASPPRPIDMVQREGGEALSHGRAQDDPQSSRPEEVLRLLTSGSTGRAEETKAALLSDQGPIITITECPDNEGLEEGQRTEEVEEQFSPAGSEEILPPEPEELREPQTEDATIPTDREDQADGDSKSELEQDLDQEEEGTGSIGSNSVALDPLEKEWMHSAACGRLAHLSQLLKQEPSLAYKKDFTSTALHWAAKHGKGDMAAMMANAGADVNIKAGYTPLHIAALHGHRHIIDLLIGTYGAKENVRDYSGHLARQYLNTKDEPGKYPEIEFQVAQNTERRNRKLAALFHHKSSNGSRKKWGSVEDLGPGGEERATPHQLALPAFRPRKFSR